MILASQLKPKQLLILYLVNQCIRKNKLRADKQPAEELAEIWLELSDDVDDVDQEPEDVDGAGDDGCYRVPIYKLAKTRRFERTKPIVDFLKKKN